MSKISRNTLTEYEYSGVLSKQISGFIMEKRALGFKYNAAAYLMKQFDIFTDKFEFPEDTLPENLVKEWFAVSDNLSDVTRYGKFSLIKLFAEYMIRLGYIAYCPVRSDFGRITKQYIPYIFTHDEIRRFFENICHIETCKNSFSKNRNVVVPMIFRVLYCCGLRISEVTHLKCSDVNLNDGILIVRDSKFGKSRYVPMSGELTGKCIEYDKTKLTHKNDDDYFFPAPDGGYYSNPSIYHIFRDVLHNIGISHGGKGKGPRLHDFRHTFAVHCLSKFVQEGVDPSNALPRLSSYLGHSSFDATDRYLRMPAEVYSEVSTALQEKLGFIIPTEEVVK